MLERKVGPPECGAGLRVSEHENRAGQALCSPLASNKTPYPGSPQIVVHGLAYDK